MLCCVVVFFFFKQKTAYEMRISDWSSEVCSSDLHVRPAAGGTAAGSPLAALPGLGTGCCGIRNKQPRHRYSPTARCCGSEFPVTNLSQWLWKNNSRKCERPMFSSASCAAMPGVVNTRATGAVRKSDEEGKR